MPNTIAYIALFSWPIFVFWLVKSRSTSQAIFIAVSSAALLLPFNFSVDFPLVPPLDRDSVTSISLLIFLFITRKKFKVFKPGLATIIIIAYFIVSIISVFVNTDPVMIKGKLLPGLTAHDAFSYSIRTFLWMMPFFLGRHFLSNTKDTEAIFKTLALMGLLYTLPMLVELRMSPQIHNWIYGYGPAEFMQQIRGDGYRPVVFIGHGLSLAFWFSTSIIAAFALKKNKVRTSLLSGAMLITYMIIILVLCKTWSAIAYAVFGMILISKISPSKQVKWALLLSAFVLIYPVTKTAGIFPDQEIVANIQGFNHERAQSLEFRFQNEDMLLEHALERPYFGWSGWGRNRMYDEYGKDITATDGRWIIEFGTKGALGFIFYYAILLIPLFYAAKSINIIQEPKEKIYFATLAIILAIGILDSILNTGMMAIHFLLAGALLGQAEILKKQKHLLVNEKIHSR